MWRFESSGELFIAPLRTRHDAILSRYDANPPPPESELYKLSAELAEVNAFLSALQQLLRSHADPTASLPLVFEADLGPLIPNYHVFQIGKWQAFFRIDSANSIAKGVYLRHLDDKPTSQLKSILDRIP